MRSKDRLAELRRAAQAQEGGAGRRDAANLTTTAAGAALLPRAPDPDPDPAAHAHRPDIEHIFLQVERMRGFLHELDGLTQLIRRLHADPDFHSNSNLQRQLEEAVGRAGRAGAALAAALRVLEAGGAGGGNDACARIARLQYVCARAQYAAALERHHAALHALQAERRALLHRQIQLTNLDITEEEYEDLLDSKNLSLFVDNVRAQTADARRALRDVEARHADLARLEGALAEMRDLFTQLAFLVAEQGARVDSVEYYALQASEHVESGQHQLLKGTVSRTKARKKQLNVILCLSAGFLVVLLVLVAT